jgi:L-fuconolactonase
LEAARLHPDRFAVMGRLDIQAPDARAKIAVWRQQPGMLGMRLYFHIQGNATDDWIWQEAEAAGVPIMMMSQGQFNLVDRAAKRYPRLKLIIIHLGTPPRTKDDAAFAEFDKLLPLAKRPNIAVMVSALPSCTTDNYPYRRLHPYIRQIYDSFGPKRMFWGTDLTRLPCSYTQAVTMFTEEIPWFTTDDKEWIMGRGLCEWIGWKLPLPGAG